MENPLSAYLTAENIKAAAFADRLGVSRSFLSRLLSGEREADSTILASIQRETGNRVTATNWVNWYARLRGEAA